MMWLGIVIMCTDFFCNGLAKLSWQLCHSGDNVERQMNSLLGTRNGKRLDNNLAACMIRSKHMVTAM